VNIPKFIQALWGSATGTAGGGCGLGTKPAVLGCGHGLARFGNGWRADDPDPVTEGPWLVWPSADGGEWRAERAFLSEPAADSPPGLSPRLYERPAPTPDPLP
jgi:hypothetical protein